MLRSFRLGTIGLIGFAISLSLQKQFASCGPASNASGGFFRDFRKHLCDALPRQRLLDDDQQVHGVAVTLQTLASQASTAMVRQYLKGHLIRALAVRMCFGFTQYC